MKRFRQYRTLIIAQCAVWLFLVACFFLVIYAEYPMLLYALSIAISYPLAFATVIYTNAFVLVPYFFRRRRKILYFILVIALLIFGSWLYANFYYFIETHFGPMNGKRMSVRAIFRTFITVMIPVFLFSLPLRLAFDYYTVRRQKDDLQKRTAEAELNLLKAQVQPHFLFNTLNNIYFVAQRESPATAELLEKLSNIMRYFVDEGPQDRIPLAKEIEFIRDYIHLEKMRMRHPLSITIDVEGEPVGVAIPPMLMIPLVENVFKHGVNKRSEENFIKLSIRIGDNELQVEVLNKLFEDLEPATHGGNGLSNLRERLRLLYGSRSTLRTEQQDGNFLAHVNIPL